ncbi:hypothetical protein [Parafilimonas terrae]|uniref:Uncharacterized protein n=1 Tax=Parafilimonas terrae TaxID=1465490 RepID=A0A1I5Z3C6_9BACT|nr:hypothetical protein [Parafilimonas terrae]SFQ50968.1 hypothetical protein SAMN05444277_11628 [Parafilimonas terrae]
MKAILPALIILLLFITCNKDYHPRTIDDNQPGGEDTSGVPTDTVSDIPFDTASSIPLNDLGKNLYMGYVGGLYPNGLNEPSGQYAQDLLEASKAIIPRDENGNPSGDGYIVFISLGASTGGKNMTALIDKTKDNPAVNPKLKLMNGNQPAGRAPLFIIADSTSDYWTHVLSIIKLHNSTPKQVQVAYLETDDSVTARKFPERPDLVKLKIETCMRTMKAVFPNLKVLYVLGRPRTFNIGPAWNTEPSPYYFGWACKWAIEDQINGKDSLSYTGEKPLAPMITWGFYQWADSLPRKTDGFYWRRTLSSDGLHANDEGQDSLSSRFQRFLFSDPYASLWYARH